jgi:hypothetical protein
LGNALHSLRDAGQVNARTGVEKTSSWMTSRSETGLICCERFMHGERQDQLVSPPAMRAAATTLHGRGTVNKHDGGCGNTP